jgi:hypothetical protein
MPRVILIHSLTSTGLASQVRLEKGQLKGFRLFDVTFITIAQGYALGVNLFSFLRKCQSQGACYSMQLDEGGGMMHKEQGRPQSGMQQDGTQQAGIVQNFQPDAQTPQMLQPPLHHQDSLADGLFQMLSGMGQGECERLYACKVVVVLPVI